MMKLLLSLIIPTLYVNAFNCDVVIVGGSASALAAAISSA